MAYPYSLSKSLGSILVPSLASGSLVSGVSTAISDATVERSSLILLYTIPFILPMKTP